MPRFLVNFLLLLTIGLSPAPAFAAEKNQGHVYVVDGDTFHMNGQKIGMKVIDTEIFVLKTEVLGRLSKKMGIKGMLCPLFYKFSWFKELKY